MQGVEFEVPIRRPEVSLGTQSNPGSVLATVDQKPNPLLLPLVNVLRLPLTVIGVRSARRSVRS